MRTTVDLPDKLLREVKARAALDGVTLKELIARYLEQWLRTGSSAHESDRRVRSELPVARGATGKTLPDLSNADLHKILDEDVGRDAGG